MQTETDELTVLLRQLDGEEWTRRLRRSDPRLGDLVRRLSPSATSLAAAIGELWELTPDAPERSHHAELLRVARELGPSLVVEPLEDELMHVLRSAGLDDRNQRIAARRLGWDGGGGVTLEAAADGKLTRERVRQIEDQVDRYVSRATPWLPSVEAALDLLAEHAPTSTEEMADLLLAEGVSRARFDPTGVIRAARMARIEPCVVIKDARVYAGKQREEAARVREAARKLVSRNGASSISGILEALQEPELDAELVRRLLSLDADTMWLDAARDWLYLPTGKNRAANYLRKMLAVAPSLSINEARDGMRRPPDREVNLPRGVLHALCECFEWTRVEGDRVMATVSLDYRDVLENTEETLVDIFREHGPVLDRATAVDLGARQGLDRTTTSLYLGWSPVIERIVTNRYALRGAKVPAGTLEAMRHGSPRRRVQRGYGWTSSGRLWVGYVLSQGAIDSHVVGVPSGLKHELRGRYLLAPPNDDLGAIATDGANLWGLARLTRRYAAEEGDALVLEFDIAEGTVYAFLGGKELLDPENRPAEVATESETTAVSDDAPDGEAADEPATIGADAEWEVFVPSQPSLIDDQIEVGVDPLSLTS